MPSGADDEAADALDRLGDQRGHVAGGLGGEDLAQVGDGRVDVIGVGPAGQQAAQPVAGVQVAHVERVQRATSTRLRLPVMPIVAKVRPW